MTRPLFVGAASAAGERGERLQVGHGHAAGLVLSVFPGGVAVLRSDPPGTVDPSAIRAAVLLLACHDF